MTRAFGIKLEKSAGEAGAEYHDEFQSPSVFRWTSQNSTTPENKRGGEVLQALDTGQRIHLFGRNDRKHPALTYCGLLAPSATREVARCRSGSDR